MWSLRTDLRTFEAVKGRTSLRILERSSTFVAFRGKVVTWLVDRVARNWDKIEADPKDPGDFMGSDHMRTKDCVT